VHLSVNAVSRVSFSLGLALLVASALSACHAISGPSQATVGRRVQAGTPSAPTPYPGKPTPAQPVPTPYPAPCAANALQVKVFPAGSYDVPTAVSSETYASEAVEFINTTSAGCYMNTPSNLTLTALPGTQQPVEIPSALSSSQQVPPGMAVLLDVGSPLTCSDPLPAEMMASLTAAFAGSGTVDIAGLNLSIACTPPVVLVYQATYLPSSTPSP
jgi:hypothetical protein